MTLEVQNYAHSVIYTRLGININASFITFQQKLFDQLSTKLFEKYEGSEKEASNHEITQCLSTFDPYTADKESFTNNIHQHMAPIKSNSIRVQIEKHPFDFSDFFEKVDPIL